MTSLHHLLNLLDPPSDGSPPTRLRTATVTDLGPPVLVDLGGAIVPTVVLDSVLPVVGGVVLVLTIEGATVVLGAVGLDGAGAYPLGTLGYAEVTANQTLNATSADLTGLSETVTVPAGRRIRVTGHGTAADAGSGRRIIVVKEGGSELGRISDHVSTPRNIFDGSVILAPTAGSHTYKLHYLVISGSNHKIEASSVNPAFILVEDIGAA